MRKVYNQPQTTSIELTMQHALCGSAGDISIGDNITGTEGD